MPTLRIRLLGDFQVTGDDGPLSAVHHPRQQALLTYLVLHRQAPQSRKHLACIFWPDTSDAQALTNLRNLLHKLRQAAPPLESFLKTDAQTLQWRPDAPFTLDVAAFEAAASRPSLADLALAAKLYGGDLLPSCFDDWILPERTRLQHLAMATFERLAGLLEEQRQYRAAIAHAERLRQMDPLNEATYRTLMRLHAANNDPAGALHVYRTCARILQHELATDPSPETRSFYERLLHMPSAPPSPTGNVQDQPPFVGRQREWKQLQEAWGAAGAGKPSSVVLTGEAGIGKTRLAEEMLSWVSRQGLAAAAAHCYAAEGALPYAPVVAWLRSAPLRKRLATLEAVWLTEVARLLPELLAEQPKLPRPGPLTQGWQRQRLFEALARAMVGHTQPLLLFIDDMQWSDSDTLEWLHYLLRFDPAARLLIIGTVRTEDVADNQPLTSLLLALRQAGQLLELALSPLGADETASLAAHVANQPLTPEQRAHLFRETEGNPLFVVEVMRSGWELGEEQAAGQPQIAPLRTLPPKVNAVLQARLAQLSPAARHLAGLAATIGREFTYPVLAQVSDQDDDELVRCLDELWQRQMVREQGADAYDFTHDKLREAAYTSMSAARRRMLHRRVAQALEAVHAQTLDQASGLIATHYELAGLFDQAVPYYQRAADVAQRVHANSDAIRYYRRALALLEGPAQRSEALASDLHEKLGDILHFTSQYDEARIAYAQALAQHPGAAVAQARLHRKTGNTWREQYRYDEAMHAYGQAEGVLRAAPSLDRQDDGRAVARTDTASAEQPQEWWQEWIQVYLEIDSVNYWLGQTEASATLGRTLQPIVEEHGTPAQRVAYLTKAAWGEFRRQRAVATDDVMASLVAALAAARDMGDETILPALQFQYGMAALWHGDPQPAIEPLQAALRMANETADITLQARCLTYLAIAQRQCGRLDETRRLAASALAVAAGAHMPEYVAMARANQAWVAWRSGDGQAAEAHGQAALASWRELPAGHASMPFQWIALWPLIAVALHRDKIAAAVECVRRLLDPALQRVPPDLADLLEQGVGAWAKNEPEAAAAVLRQAAALAQQRHYL